LGHIGCKIVPKTTYDVLNGTSLLYLHHLPCTVSATVNVK